GRRGRSCRLLDTMQEVFYDILIDLLSVCGVVVPDVEVRVVVDLDDHRAALRLFDVDPIEAAAYEGRRAQRKITDRGRRILTSDRLDLSESLVTLVLASDLP